MPAFVLYRGDYEVIKSFNTLKTNKWGYVGPGVYLTDSLKVAHSYRNKGANRRVAIVNPILFQGDALNRLEALAKSFNTFLYWYTKKEGYRDVTPDELSPVVKKRAQECFDDCVKNGTITVDYVNTVLTTKGLRTLRVDLNTSWEHAAGCVTEFSFDKKTFLDGVFHKDRVPNEVFDICRDVGLKRIDRESLTDYITRVRKDIVNEIAKSSRARSALMSYGYRGIEYRGGAVTNSHFGLHRAFAIWDDEYVNAHFVRRVK